MNDIARAGRQLQRLVAVLLILTPVVYLGLFAWKGFLPLLRVPAEITVDLDGLGIMATSALLLLGAMTPLVFWGAFFVLWRLAGHYAQGNVFTGRAAALLRGIGVLLLLTDFVYMLQSALTGPLLAVLGLSAGFISIELKLGTSVIGLFILLIGRIMVKAAALDEQQRLTI